MHNTRLIAGPSSSRRQMHQRIVAAIILATLVRQLQASLWGGSGMKLPELEDMNDTTTPEASMFGTSGCCLPEDRRDSTDATRAITTVIFGGGCGCADENHTIR